MENSFINKIFLFFYFVYFMINMSYGSTVNRKHANDVAIETCDTVCCTTECVVAWFFIYKNIKEGKDPCRNFYEFACGKFLEGKKIPKDEDMISSADSVADSLTDTLKKLLEDEVSESLEIPPIREAKEFYNFCMDSKVLNELGLKDIISYFSHYEGWPILQKQWSEDAFNWTEVTQNYIHFGFKGDYVIKFSVVVNPKNSSRYTLQIDQPNLELPREYLLEGKTNYIVKAYDQYMVDIAVQLGADREIAEDDFKQVLDFEIELAKITLSSNERRNIKAVYQLMTIQELQNYIPGLYWIKFINQILFPDVKLSSSENILVNSPEYFKNLITLINTTPKRTFANFIMWKIAAESVPFLTDRIRDRHFKYIKDTTGQTRRKPRDEECVNIVNQYLPIATAALYVNKTLNKKARDNMKTRVTSIIKNIEDQFKDMLINAAWMDEESKREAKEKLESMTYTVAYPDELLDDRTIIQYYKSLKLISNKYFSSWLSIKNFNRITSFNMLLKTVNKTDWTTRKHSAIVDAFYYIHQNSYELPAGILQKFYFDAKHPDFLNYGSIGSIIGHEISHAFDDEGRYYDKNSELRQWWSRQTENNFIEHTNCIINQYNEYKPKGQTKHVDGQNTQGENIADNVGVKAAYLAYTKMIESSQKEKPLPQLNYTSKQLFWISYANSLCTIYRDSKLNEIMVDGLHAPAEFRVNGPLSNSEEFVKDFNCADREMDRPNKCAIW